MTQSKSRVQTRTKAKQKTSVRETVLTDLEERVLRMRYGLVVSDKEPLEFRGQQNEETQQTLEALERRALWHIKNSKEEASKQAIIEEMQER